VIQILASGRVGTRSIGFTPFLMHLHGILIRHWKYPFAIIVAASSLLGCTTVALCARLGSRGVPGPLVMLAFILLEPEIPNPGELMMSVVAIFQQSLSDSYAVAALVAYPRFFTRVCGNSGRRP
jgi:hypothetical protein